MKRLWICVLLFCLAGHAVAQNTTADQNASCNASFHEGCKSDQTFTTSSSGFAAPAGVLGSSALESSLIALLIAAGIGRRLYRVRSGGGGKRDPGSAAGQPHAIERSAARQDGPAGEGPC